jgi:hypothetical protein
MRRSSIRQRYVVSLVALGSLALVSLAVVTLTGQTPASTSKSKSASSTHRTAWGDPDLQGTWFVLYDVPLERSAANKDKPFLTDAEVAAANKAKESSPGRNLRSSGAQSIRRTGEFLRWSPGRNLKAGAGAVAALRQAAWAWVWAP